MIPAQEGVVRAALAQWGGVSGITFVEQADALGADIRFGTNEQPSSLGYAYYPPVGDVYIDVDAVTPYVLIHEIGHAIGLKHPGDYGSRPPFLPDEEDTRDNTVMSYNGATVEELQAFDIAAVQYLYGVNPDARTGDDTYFLAGGEPIIWDGGGTDTISAAGIAVATHIDLNDGHRSWIGAREHSILADGQYFIGYHTAIENAIGGAAADAIIGNKLANLLYGGAGNDSLTGGQGDDTLIGGAGRDCFDFTTPLSARSNVDTLIEFNPAADMIRLDNDVFTALTGVNAPLARSAFYAGAAAHDATDRIVYDTGTGNLCYDADGTGAAGARLFAVLAGAPAISAADFFVIA
jgi:Ca2+-binding RTX toxin-like protein